MSSEPERLRERIAELAQQIHAIHMIDRWTRRDREQLDRLEAEIAQARAQLKRDAGHAR